MPGPNDDFLYGRTNTLNRGTRLSDDKRQQLAAVLAGFPAGGVADALKAAGAVNAVPFNAFTAPGDGGLPVNGVPGASAAGARAFAPAAPGSFAPPFGPVPGAGYANAVSPGAPGGGQLHNVSQENQPEAEEQDRKISGNLGSEPPSSHPWGELPRGYYVDPDWLREEAIKKIRIQAAPAVKDTVNCNRENAGLIFYNFKTYKVRMSSRYPGKPCGTEKRAVCYSKPNRAIGEKRDNEVIIATWHTHPESDTRYHSHMRFKDGREEGDIPDLNELLNNAKIPQFIGGFVIDWEGGIYFYNNENKGAYKKPVGTVIGLSRNLEDKEYRRQNCPQEGMDK
jgi:hypothetical protein